MKQEQPVNVHHVLACHRLVESGGLPFLVTNEKRAANIPGSWCTHAIGMELVVYISGSGVLRTPTVVQRVHRGSVCLIPPDVFTKHISAPDTPINYWNFLFLESHLRIGDLFLPTMTGYRRLTEFHGEGENRISPVFCIDHPLVNDIDTIGNNILAEQTFHRQGWQIFCSTAFLYLIGRILREYRSDPQSFRTVESRIEQLAEFIERNCSQPLDLDSLSKRAGMSPSTFSHSFRRIKQLSPIEYAIRCRLRKAVTMFAYCSDISQIAYECGFTDITYFSRLFRNRMGLSPREFQKLPVAQQRFNIE